jgi:hypothetical protein
VLSGGSVYGLAAADGVVVGARGGRGRAIALVPNSACPRSPVVPAAILYDLANAGDKAWGEAPPYRDLGMRALKSVGSQHSRLVVQAQATAHAPANCAGRSRLRQYRHARWISPSARSRR